MHQPTGLALGQDPGPWARQFPNIAPQHIRGRLAIILQICLCKESSSHEPYQSAATGQQRSYRCRSHKQKTRLLAGRLVILRTSRNRKGQGLRFLIRSGTTRLNRPWRGNSHSPWSHQGHRRGSGRGCTTRRTHCLRRPRWQTGVAPYISARARAGHPGTSRTSLRSGRDGLRHRASRSHALKPDLAKALRHTGGLGALGNTVRSLPSSTRWDRNPPITHNNPLQHGRAC